MKLKVILVIVSFFIMAMCISSCSKKTTQTFNLENTAWSLKSFTNNKETTPALKQIATSLDFKEGKIEGMASCNRFFGAFQATDKKIRFDKIGSTRMSCETEVNQQENTFLNLLRSATSYKVDDNLLYIYQNEHNYITLEEVKMLQY